MKKTINYVYVRSDEESSIFYCRYKVPERTVVLEL
jgi:hypothetical protein